MFLPRFNSWGVLIWKNNSSNKLKHFFVTLRKCCSFFLSFFFWIKDISLCYILEVSFCSRGIWGSFLKWNLFSTQLQLIKFALQQQQQTKMFSFFHYTFSCFYATKIKFLSFINFHNIWIILSVSASFLKQVLKNLRKIM
jgi:hypothetical protein